MSSPINQAQQRLMSIVEMLANDTVIGYSPIKIARHLGTSPSNITRDMANLREHGWAERNEEHDTWKLTPRIGQQAVKILNSIQRYSDMAEQARNRFTRTSD